MTCYIERNIIGHLCQSNPTSIIQTLAYPECGEERLLDVGVDANQQWLTACDEGHTSRHVTHHVMGGSTQVVLIWVQRKILGTESFCIVCPKRIMHIVCTRLGYSSILHISFRVTSFTLGKSQRDIDWIHHSSAMVLRRQLKFTIMKRLEPLL